MKESFTAVWPWRRKKLRKQTPRYDTTHMPTQLKIKNTKGFYHLKDKGRFCYNTNLIIVFLINFELCGSQSDIKIQKYV